MKRFIITLALIGMAGFAGAGELERLSQSNAITRVGNSGVEIGAMEQMSTSVQLGRVTGKNIRKVGVAEPGRTAVNAAVKVPREYKRAAREEILAASRAYAASGNERLAKYLNEKAGGSIKRDAVLEMAIQGGYTREALTKWMRDAANSSQQDREAIAEGGDAYAKQFGPFGSAKYTENLKNYTEEMVKNNIPPKKKSCSSCQ